MAMGKRAQERQAELWLATTAMIEAPGHPFCRQLNEVLVAKGLLKGKTVGMDATTLEANATLTELKAMALSEPARGQRDWQDKEAERVARYGNRRRIRGQRGRALMRKRGELLERSFAHCCETGGLRRTHRRGHGNILKRLLVHVVGFNLGLVMSQRTGLGKRRRTQDGRRPVLDALSALWDSTRSILGAWRRRVGRLGRVAAALPLEIPLARAA